MYRTNALLQVKELRRQAIVPVSVENGFDEKNSDQGMERRKLQNAG